MKLKSPSYDVTRENDEWILWTSCTSLSFFLSRLFPLTHFPSSFNPSFCCNSHVLLVTRKSSWAYFWPNVKVVTDCDQSLWTICPPFFFAPLLLLPATLTLIFRSFCLFIHSFLCCHVNMHQPLISLLFSSVCIIWSVLFLLSFLLKLDPRFPSSTPYLLLPFNILYNVTSASIFLSHHSPAATPFSRFLLGLWMYADCEAKLYFIFIFLQPAGTETRAWTFIFCTAIFFKHKTLRAT